MRTEERKRAFRRFFRAALALVCVFALMVPELAVPSVQAVKQSGIDALKSSAKKSSASAAKRMVGR